VVDEIREEGRERANPQYNHFKAFIDDFIEDCDAMPTTGNENVKITPFLKVSHFYEEFKMHWDLSYGGGETLQAPSYTTFLGAFESFNESVRLMRCKGNFSTCELCSNATELLTSRKYNKQERKLILEYRKQHLKEQARQREALELEKIKAAALDYNGQPTQCVFFSDAITETRGQTPNWGRSSSKADAGAPQVGNRTIGVEAYCGPVRTIFLYHTDEFSLGHGANIMVEVMRQALKDLAYILHNEHRMVMPKKAHFQFDNSGENKVSTLSSLCNN
jgi:hypothetical protein